MSSVVPDRQATRDPGDSPDAEGRIPFRLRIGVSGHRALEDEERVATQVAGCLRALRAVFAPTPETPVCFTILSALAEGADRLVVRQALAVLDDVRVEAVLPRDAGDYQKDFGSAASRRDFEDLLAHASRRMMPAVADPEDGYELAGRYVVDESDLLVAIWDGEPARGRAGTANVVAYARSRKRPVVVVHTGAATAAAPVAERIERDSPGARRLLASLRRLDGYNAGSLAAEPFRRALAGERSRLDRAGARAPIRHDVDRVAAWSLPRLVRAEVRAVRFQRAYHLLGDVVYLLAASAVTTVAAQTVFAHEHTGVLAVEIACLLLIIAVVVSARVWGVQDRWMDFRSLAEAFRSALFIALSGPRDRDEDKRGTERREGEPWYQRAFSESWSRRPVTMVGSDADADAALRRFIVDAWLDDQVAYHRATARHSRVRDHRLGLTVAALMTAALTVAALHFAEVGEGTRWADWLTFLAIALPGFGAAVTGIREHRLYRLHARRSERTADRLQRLKDQMETGGRATSAQSLAVDIQGIILEESVEWSGVQELQDLEIVI